MSPRTRTILVWVLLVLGTLILFVGSLTVWVKRQALDTNAWVDTSGQLLENKDVRQALSVYIVDQLYSQGAVQARLEKRLPPNLSGLAGPIAGALREPAQSAVDNFLQRPRVQTAWKNANRVAQKELVAILEGKSRAGVSTVGGEVTLDLRSFLVNVGTQLGIGAGLDARLPPDAGHITIMKSNQLDAAQKVVKVIKALSWVLIFAALAAYGGAIALAHGRRRETLRIVAGSFLLVGILLLVIRNLAGSYIVDALANGQSIRDAGNATWLIGTSLLAKVAWALIVYGAVTLCGVALAGPSRTARRFREWIGPMLRDHPGTAWAILAGVFLVIVLWGPTPALRTWLGVLLLGGLAAIGFEAFRRVTVGELEAGAGGGARAPS